MSSTITDLADEAAADIEQLARLTRPAITTINTAELVSILAALTQLAGALPQTLHQLQAYLPSTAALDQTRTRLCQASLAAAHLAVALDTARQDVGHAAEDHHRTAKGSKFNRR